MKPILFILKYLTYLITSKNKHSIQGPFIFSFVTKVINSKTENQDCKMIENLRKKLAQSKEKIQITDFGAGSKINDSRERGIKDIVLNSSKNKKFGKLLYRIINYFKPENIIELGTSLGVSTCYLAKANPNAKIFTFEGCYETAKIAQKNFKQLKINNIELVRGNFNSTLKEKLAEIKKIDFVFFDGNHQKEPTLLYFSECLKYAQNDTIFVFDDIYWSKGMQDAWNEIKNHSKTTVTIDLFFLGIVFIKKELSKEHFKIRF